MHIINDLILFLEGTNPALLLIASGIFLFRMPQFLFRLLAVTIPTFSIFIILFIIKDNNELPQEIGNFYIPYFKIHPFSKIISSTFLLSLILASIYSFSIPKSKATISAAFFYTGCAIGVLFASNLISFVIMWELMTIGSAIIIFEARTKQSYEAGMRYILIHIIAGAILVTGISMNIYNEGTNEIPNLSLSYDDFIAGFSSFDQKYLPKLLIFVGIAINLAVPPFSAWLPDAYSSASPLGSILLSSFTTKTAAFAMLLIFGGSSILIPTGIIMIFYGIIYAIMENDIRKILSYSIINQLGFMVVAFGIGNELAITGSIIHLCAHILYNTLFFMCAASVIIMSGKSKLWELGNLCKYMKITFICSIICSFNISALPLSLEFTSKTMILDSLYGHEILWIMLIIASSLVVMHGGMKFTWGIFCANNPSTIAKDPPFFMSFAMIIASLFLIFIGIFPGFILEFLPHQIMHNPYTPHHMFGHLQLMLFSFIAYFVTLVFTKNKDTVTLDFDWLYRVMGNKILLIISLFYELCSVMTISISKTVSKYCGTLLRVYFGNKGIASFSTNLSSTIVILIFLIVFLIVLGYIIPFPKLL